MKKSWDMYDNYLMSCKGNVMSKQLSCCGKCEKPGDHISNLKKIRGDWWPSWQGWWPDVTSSVVLVSSVAKYVRGRHPGAQILDRRVFSVSLGPTCIIRKYENNVHKKVWKYLRQISIFKTGHAARHSFSGIKSNPFSIWFKWAGGWILDWSDKGCCWHSRIQKKKLWAWKSYQIQHCCWSEILKAGGEKWTNASN